MAETSNPLPPCLEHSHSLVPHNLASACALLQLHERDIVASKSLWDLANRGALDEVSPSRDAAPCLLWALGRCTSKQARFLPRHNANHNLLLNGGASTGLTVYDNPAPGYSQSG
jgi:hypothetical protein